MDDRLEATRKRLAVMETKVQRLKGRQASAQEELARVEEECRAKGVEPAKLEETIAKLNQKLEEALSELEVKTRQAEEKLARFTEDA